MSPSPRKKAKKASTTPTAGVRTRGRKAFVHEDGVVRVAVLDNKECIHLGSDLLDHIVKDMLENVPASRYVLITDRHLEKIVLPQVKQKFASAGINLLVKVVPPGEQSKCRSVKEDIENWMLENFCDRKTCVLALGGGVIGDLAGYVAATYMRGVNFVQIPTSLLAMVDSSIGGKTGVDTSHGKNLIGAFHQPKRIYINLSFLKTLPSRHFNNGMAEVIKTAAFWDADAFEFIEQNAQTAKALDDMDVVKEIVLSSVRVKAHVVTEDEKEGGLRSILNFGHTIGHAIEALCQPSMLHGEAIAIGMVKEAEIARSMELFNQASLGRLVRCIQLYDLPTIVPSQLGIADLFTKMNVDKKTQGGRKAVVLLRGIGKTLDRGASFVSDEKIYCCLSEYISVIPPEIPVKGKVLVPGSKSISNRVLLLAALGKGKCRIKGLLHSDDTQVMLNALCELGVPKFEWEAEGNIVSLKGCAGILNAPQKEVYLGNAGTASRFLTSVAAIASNGEEVVLTGNKRMQERPIGPLVEALRANGVSIRYLSAEGCLPIGVKSNQFQGGEVSLAANVSSQYVSSILISSPYSETPVKLSLVGEEVVSQSYIDMTSDLLRRFGINVQRREGTNEYSIEKGVYLNPKELLVEGDASSATYPLAIAAITGGVVSVENVGSESLQGDAEFALLLEKMGCSYRRTKTSTEVTGPPKGTRLKSFELDMGSMTDAFMTAAVLAAIADGTSKIYNIANQRVKECNRIAAMIEELTKMGVTCRELPDGLEIDGLSPSEFKQGPFYINCHDDHRIAMSFGVLGCKIPGIVITEKSCVCKTYPEFWDHLVNKFGVKLDASSWQRTERNPVDSSKVKRIVVIGMRGAGKSKTSALAGLRMGLRVVDMDKYLENELGMSLKQYINTAGWPAFRAKELGALASVLGKDEYAEKCIIVCGGGVVETEAARNLLQKEPNVVSFRRSIDDICEYLCKDAVRPSFKNDPAEQYKIRGPLYAQCSTYEFNICKSDCDWKGITEDFISLISHIITGVKMPDLNESSYFLSLTFPRVEDVLKLDFDDIFCGSHALELRVDLLESWDHQFVMDQCSKLRRACKLPIIFTVRSRGQGGKFPDEPEKMFSLLELGARLGCEYVDMESHWPVEYSSRLLATKKGSKIIASYHAPPNNCSIGDLRGWFDVCQFGGRADIVKIVGRSKDLGDNYQLQYMIREVGLDKPLIAISMGPKGTLSRALNTFMTPVTHEKMPFKAAPGQLTIKEIHDFRQLLGLLPPQKFCLFGSPIAHSPSPVMHNAGFKKMNLPHEYGLCETVDCKKVEEVIEDSSFGGANVTIPLKQAVIPLMDKLSDAAKCIGAVNTIKKVDGVITGHNTDWLGIVNPIEELVKQVGYSKPRRGLVVGAGGTARAACYALQKLGVTYVLIYNRTYEKAVSLAREFSGEAVKDLNEIDLIDVVVCTVPATTCFELPAGLLKNKPILFDVAYKPRNTSLIRQGREAGCPVIEGIQMLIEQGKEGFRIWTGFNAPGKEMSSAVYENYKG
eukprot:Nk52_evm2s745 gene=Nk52_evmTU2s745